MKSRNNQLYGSQKSRDLQGQGPNWVFIIGGALLSTLSVRLGCKLKQALGAKQEKNSSNGIKGNARSDDRSKAAACHLHSNFYPCLHDEDGCSNYVSDTECTAEMVHPENEHGDLPIVTVARSEQGKVNRVLWASSPDRLELPPKQFHHSNCSDSPHASESGSDIFSKREVINKLRQQLKRRDEMIMEMHDQITELQNSLNSESTHASHLQSQLDLVNKDLFDSQIEIQRLRKVIADHCLGHVGSNNRTSSVKPCAREMQNGHTNGYLHEEYNLKLSDERIEMLQKEASELKEVLEGKDYLLQSYKEQKTEFSMKIKELQQRLDSQLPNIL